MVSRSSTSGSDLRLLASVSGTSAVDGTAAADMVGNAAATGSPHVLIIIDTCHADAALPAANTSAALLQQAHPPDAQHTWVGVLVSARAGEPATDGACGQHPRHLLKSGAKTSQDEAALAAVLRVHHRR